MKAFQEIREPRCKLVQEWSFIQSKRATVPDGPEQEARDKKFKTFNSWNSMTPWDGVHIDELPAIDSGNWQAWLCGHDAVAFVS
jgi:salicylate hydroxylase